MAKKNDRKDELILQQLETIRTMAENNLSRMNTDFWGSPAKGAEPTKPSKSAQGVQTHESVGRGIPDTPQREAPPPEKIEDLVAELEGYIGLENVKKEVKSLINMVKVHKMRAENGLPTADLSLHMVFSGNPGTGKTTVGRIMARIYHSLGILSKGQLVEVDRSGLVAGYVGQTALKTKKVIEKALGGVLFIDEAYALNGRSENDFGQEAIDTVLKAMEDHREDLVVIVAGYTELMEEFIHSNPGLESRFNRFLEFGDYTLDEMMAIFRMRCEKGRYTLAEDAEEAVRTYITEENVHPETFGNARGVRNLYEKILVQQANRLAAAESVTKEELMLLTKEDIQAAREA